MYRETAKTKTKSIFFVIGAIALYLIGFSIVDILDLPFKGIIQLVLLLIVALAVYTLVRFNLCIYEYNLFENELIFISKIGSIERIIARVEISSIEFAAPYGNSILETKKEVFRYNAKKSMTKRGVYVLVFKDENMKICKLAFEPTMVFLNKLRELDITVY